MSIRSYYRRILIMILIASVIYTIAYSCNYFNDSIPDEINIQADSSSKVAFEIPISATLSSEDCEVMLRSESGIPKDKVKISHKDIISLESEKTGKYNLKVKLLGIFDVKSIKVNVVEKRQVIPCGCPIGIYLETDGVMVIGTGTVMGMDGNNYEPSKDKVQSGDYIESLNNIPVSSKSQLIFLIDKYGDKEIILGIRRNHEHIRVKIESIPTSASEYKLGIWVRDDTQGIGTLTYIDEHGKFGALGHGISDVDTGQLLSSDKGILYKADIWGIKKGQNGTPGGLCGTINYEDDSVLGDIISNTDSGIFGMANEKLQSLITSVPMDICLKQDINEGDAKIRCMVEDEIKDYDIEIISVDKNNNSGNKGMVIQVTDPELLAVTNGIVQGLFTSYNGYNTRKTQ